MHNLKIGQPEKISNKCDRENTLNTNKNKINEIDNF